MNCENCLNTGQVVVGLEENLQLIICPVCEGRSKVYNFIEDLSIPEDTLESDYDTNDNFINDY